MPRQDGRLKDDETVHSLGWKGDLSNSIVAPVWPARSLLNDLGTQRVVV